MKKNIKKCLALLLSVVMVLAMSISVFASDVVTDTETNTETETKTETQKYTLTINKQDEQDASVTYNLYQLFTCTLDASNMPTYTKDNATNSALVGEKTVEDFEKMTNADLLDFIATISTKDVVAHGTITTGEPETLPAGYYLAVPTNKASVADDNLSGGTVSQPIIAAVPGIIKSDDGKYTVIPNVTPTSKSSGVTHKKEITKVAEEETTKNYTTNTSPLGEADIIEYTLTNTVPLYSDDVQTDKVNYYVTDNYDSDLSLIKTDPITVTAPSSLQKGQTVKDEEFTAADGTKRIVKHVTDGDYAIVRDDSNHSFVVYFNFDKISASTNVVISAKFNLKNTAKPGEEIPNDSKLTYTNNYYKGTDSDSDLEDKVKSWTFKFNVFKYDTDTKTALPGATFGLYKDAECKTLIKEAQSATSTGIVDFATLLNEGTYYVKEISAPSGYKADEKVHVVSIVANKDQDSEEFNGTATITVDGNAVGTEVKDGETPIYTNEQNTNQIPTFGVGNTHGATLPGTGGIGTTIFTFGGLALVILAAAMFIVYMKKQKKQA